MKLKKKAIFSALAMLIVTAIALSSATFAWFSAGTTVGVDQLTATVSNNDGSLQISATGTAGSWKTQLSLLDLQGAGTNLLPGTLTPVSTTLAASGATIIGGALTTVEDPPASGTFVSQFTASTPATGYIKYTVYLKATQNMTVTITPNLARTTNFIYAGLEDTGTATKLIGTASRKYTPIAKSDLVAVDTNNDDVLSTTEAGTGGLGTEQTAEGLTAQLSMDLIANDAKPFVVYIWAEGQDVECIRTFTTDNMNFSLTIAK